MSEDPITLIFIVPEIAKVEHKECFACPTIEGCALYCNKEVVNLKIQMEYNAMRKIHLICES